MFLAAQKMAEQIFAPKDINDIILRACALAIEAQNLPKVGMVFSSEVAIILAELNLDNDTLIATLVSDVNLDPYYSVPQITEMFGANISSLVQGIRKLNQFQDIYSKVESNDIQNERLRQMLLAMTSDIRIMIVKLAYRVARMRTLKFEDATIQYQVARETQLIFAPLANRLGIAQLKWELEDLSFRYLQPDTYRSIAKLLDTNRQGRETYIKDVIAIFTKLMQDSKIEHQISGRPKHIYSIWKKMSKKQLPISELYDLRAIRIYVESISQCYEVLGMIHSRWNYVKTEFDDYIASPKDNGYQSIHTVIYGPENKTVEIQIRTHEMHYTSEYGVAAHWKYKEGNKNIDASLEQSINIVRQMLEYNDDPDFLNQISTELLSEHIYVMTPNNDIITLSQGSTALDFAYQIHTNLGHGCRGAKINGKITPLTTLLQTGDKVEILSVKNGAPSRNWLNPNLGYLGHSRSRQKVRTWFNHQNKEANIDAGEALLAKETRRLHLEKVDMKNLIEKFHVNTKQQLFEAIGKGQVNERQLASALQKQIQPKVIQPRPVYEADKGLEKLSNFQPAYVVGSPTLRTHLAPCCNPEEGNDIVGYVTRGRGITVHRSDCANILNLTHEELQRIIEVDWFGQKDSKEVYSAQIDLLAFDRKGLLRDVMNCLTQNDINLTASNTFTDPLERTVTMRLTVELDETVDLGNLLDKIESIQNVETASLLTL